MKILTTALYACALMLGSIAFTSFTTVGGGASVEIPANLTITNQWVPLTTQDGIQISYKFSDCHFPKFNWQQRWVLLKMENTTGSTKTVDWDLNLWFNGTCKTCVDPNGEYHRTIVIDGNQTSEGMCDLNGDSRLNVFVKFNDKANVEELTKFELGNLTVSE